MKPTIQIKRVYDKPAENDGFRVLVDRLWPRGVTKSAAQVALWAKALTPSHELRKWYHENPSRHEEFNKQFGAELETRKDEIASFLMAILSQRTVTLLTASRQPETGHVPAIEGWLQSSLFTSVDRRSLS